MNKIDITIIPLIEKQPIEISMTLPGPQGEKGDDGYTPVKGIDYFDGDEGPPGPQVEVVNNLDEEVEGKALDAVQGKVLKDKLGSHEAEKVSIGDNPHGINDAPTWVTLTLLNGWTGAQVYGYSKDAIGNVRLRGRLIPGTKTDGTVLFTLPVEFRPAYSKMFSYGNAALLVLASGGVEIYGFGSMSYIEINNVSFLAKS